MEDGLTGPIGLAIRQPVKVRGPEPAPTHLQMRPDNLALEVTLKRTLVVSYLLMELGLPGLNGLLAMTTAFLRGLGLAQTLLLLALEHFAKVWTVNRLTAATSSLLEKGVNMSSKMPS